MDIKIFDQHNDSVIESSVSVALTSYRFALSHLLPLIDRFEAQRKPQDKKFYKRLERDIIAGCIMPPLTIAFVGDTQGVDSAKDVEKLVKKSIDQGFILDGIQRLLTLRRASEDDDFDENRPIYLNIIIAPSQDKLLYRMITLNNGQKPMTPRHQIEILTSELFDFSALNIPVQTEKERSNNQIKNAFSVADFSRAYLAFLTNDVHNENNKIIGEKMDEIIVRRIMDNRPQDYHVEFEQILNLISRISQSPKIKTWLKVPNNLIGFVVGLKTSFEHVNTKSIEDLEKAIELFDDAFDNINPSKVNLGKYRRELSRKFIENFSSMEDADESGLTEQFATWTAS